VELWGEGSFPGAELAEENSDRELVALDGEATYEVEDLGTAKDSWRVVIYFDQAFSEGTLFRGAAATLAEKARELTALGSVEVVLADPEVTLAHHPTRNPEELADFLNWLNIRESADGAQRRLRQSLRRDLEQLKAGIADRDESSLDRAQAVSMATNAAEEEGRLIEQFLDPMLIWASENREQGPQALILVSGGFDADSLDFYSNELRAEFPTARFEPTASLDHTGLIEATANALSTYGWEVFPFSPSSRGELLPVPGVGDRQPSLPGRPAGGIATGNDDERVLSGIDPRKLLKRKKETGKADESAELILNPLEPLRIVAASGGGKVLTETRELAELLQGLPLRRHYRYQREFQPTVDQEANLVEVRSRPSTDARGDQVEIAARRWFSRVTPQAVSDARIRRILNDQLDEGELLISAAARPSATDRTELHVQVQSEGQPAGSIDPTAVRVTVAIAVDGERTEVRHYADPKDQGEGILTLEAIGSSEEDMPVVVLVEDLASGLWGAAFASELEESAEPDSIALDEGYLLPGPKAIHLLAPSSAMVTGPTTFRTVLSEPSIAQVDFYLDGEKKTARFSAPFSAVIDLGPLPRTRQIGVVALSSEGKEVARDEILVNGGSGVFSVRITQPSLDQVDKKLLTGPVDVAASIEGPDHRAEIDRVEFYWKNELVATRYAAPFRQRIRVSEDAPKGFIRVIAYLEDGNSSEDVLFLNNPGTSERLQIDLVELYVVVTDRKGRPVKDLKQEQFSIREEGEELEIATFGDAGQLPLTVGLAIDSSASMFVKLGDVRAAAGQFVRGLATRRDRAFLVGFGNEPELHRRTTSNLPEVLRALDRLTPDGKTSIWKAVVYSLVQLQGVPGKKALIVYTDGADEDPDFSYRTCLRFARQVGVPIYFILTNNEIVRTDGKGLSVRGFLGRLNGLTEDVGGKVFLSRIGEDLEAVYREIDEELRSQYLLGFYTQSQAGLQWKRLEVDAKGLGHRARTIAGFYR
jgi:Ca-activated chloride channel family protein